MQFSNATPAATACTTKIDTIWAHSLYQEEGMRRWNQKLFRQLGTRTARHCALTCAHLHTHQINFIFFADCAEIWGNQCFGCLWKQNLTQTKSQSSTFFSIFNTSSMTLKPLNLTWKAVNRSFCYVVFRKYLKIDKKL